MSWSNFKYLLEMKPNIKRTRLVEKENCILELVSSFVNLVEDSLQLLNQKEVFLHNTE